jgi:hypothetical protein
MSRAGLQRYRSSGGSMAHRTGGARDEGDRPTAAQTRLCQKAKNRSKKCRSSKTNHTRDASKNPLQGQMPARIEEVPPRVGLSRAHFSHVEAVGLTSLRRSVAAFDEVSATSTPREEHPITSSASKCFRELLGCSPLKSIHEY